MAEYRIDELAQMAGTTVRNVRLYRERGLLPEPRREGRVAIYSDVHLARLRLIASLLKRGYTMAHITELLSAWQEGRDLAHVLGLERALIGPWTREVPTYVSEAELVEMIGPAGAGSVDRLIESGLVEREGDRFKMPSPRIMQAGAELLALGMSMDQVLDLAERLRAHTDRIADDIVGAPAAHVLGGHPSDWVPSDDELADIVAFADRLRPLALAAVEASLATSIEHRLEELLGDHVPRLGEVVARRRHA